MRNSGILGLSVIIPDTLRVLRYIVEWPKIQVWQLRHLTKGKKMRVELDYHYEGVQDFEIDENGQWEISEELGQRFKKALAELEAIRLEVRQTARMTHRQECVFYFETEGSN